MAAQTADRGFFVRVFGRFGAYINGVREEMQKVIWPTKDQVKTYTLVVLVAATVIALILGLFDYVLGKGFAKLLEFF